MGETYSFNPRAYAGRDSTVRHTHSGNGVSIHAPTRGATLLPHHCYVSICFNPRAHAGRDSTVRHTHSGNGVSIHAPTRGATAMLYGEGKYATRFQSTRPRGARRRVHELAGETVTGFNPRAHAGRDLMRRSFCRRMMFQSTRPRGARQNISSEGVTPKCFNPRAHAGRDIKQFWGGINLRQVSIHAPTRGATYLYIIRRYNIISFNPRAHAGRDDRTNI